MRNKKQTFEELIDRLLVCVEKNNPNRTIGDTEREVLINAWRHKPINLLLKAVKLLEIKTYREKQEKESIEDRHVEYLVGVDVIGNPIICHHRVVFKTDFEHSKRYSKSNAKEKVRYFTEQWLTKLW